MLVIGDISILSEFITGWYDAFSARIFEDIVIVFMATLLVGYCVVVWEWF